MKNTQEPKKKVHYIKKTSTTVLKSKDGTITKYPERRSGNTVSQLTKTTKNYSKKLPNKN